MPCWGVMGHFLFNVTAPNKALSVPSVLYSILKYFSMLVINIIFIDYGSAGCHVIELEFSSVGSSFFMGT